MRATIRVGQIVAAFGIRGQVKVKPLTDFIERFDVGRRLRLEDQWVTIKSSGEHKGSIILKLSGIDDRNRAESLQWAYLEAVAEERPKLDEDEYLTDDLIGLRVLNMAGQELGVVKSVQRYPAHDVLVIGTVMVPAVAQFVKAVDIAGKTLTIDPIPGMFDEVED